MCVTGEDPTTHNGASALVLVVNFHSAAAVSAFLDQLVPSSDLGIRVRVVDNSASEGGAIPRLPADAGIDSVSTPSNLGYLPGAAYALLDYLRSYRMPDWVIICNPDIEIDGPAFFSRLSSRHAGEAIAALAPRILTPRGVDSGTMLVTRPSRYRMQFLKWVFRSYYSSLAYTGTSRIKRALVAKLRRPLRETTSRRIYAPHGSFLVLSRQYFEQGGTLHHGARLFGEEIFIAETALSLGLPIIHDPELVVYHRGNVTIGELPSRQVAEYMRDASTYVADRYFHLSPPVSCRGTAR